MSEKQPDMVYIQRDLEAIKHTLDKVLGPFKSEMKQLREENASLRANIGRKEADVEALRRLIVRHDPEHIDTALTALLDPNRRGFRSAWRHRLGLDP